MEEQNQRLVTPLGHSDESAAELALRPKALSEFIGQHRVREQIDVLLQLITCFYRDLLALVKQHWH